MKTDIISTAFLLVSVIAQTAPASPTQPSSETGRTTEPVEITLRLNGEPCGKGTLPARSLVRIHARDVEEAYIESRIGSDWVPASALEVTMEPLDFEEDAVRIAREQTIRSCRPCPRRTHPQQTRTVARHTPRSAMRQDTGKINIASSNSSFERTVLDLTNQARRQQGLPALQWSESLAKAARYHAAHMAKHNYFDHDTKLPDGRRISTRERISHFDANYSGENIAWGQRSPQAVIKSWLGSPGHRSNMLKRDSTRLGVGYVRGYWVQVFGR